MNVLKKFMILCLLWLSTSVQAHDLHHQVTDGQAIVVQLFFVDNSPFAYENYELYREGDALPYQTGITDAHGRVSFIPDLATNWKVKVFSEDGHGASFDVTSSSDLTLSYSEKPFIDRYGRVVIGISILFGIFGVFSLVLNRKKAGCKDV